VLSAVAVWVAVVLQVILEGLVYLVGPWLRKLRILGRHLLRRLLGRFHSLRQVMSMAHAWQLNTILLDLFHRSIGLLASLSLRQALHDIVQRVLGR